MKLVILKNNILEGLGAVERAVSSSANLPVLKNALVKAEGGKITFTAMNLEVAITQLVAGKIVEEGEITVPVSVFGPVAKNLNAERVTIETKDRHLLVTTDNYEATIQAQDATDFPTIPDAADKESYVRARASALLEAIQSVIVATQYSEIRPEISGVHFHWFDGALTLAATDSFRLAERVLRGDDVSSTVQEASMILPYRAAEEFCRFLAGVPDDVHLFVEPNQVVAKTASKRFVSRLVDGNFPEYKNIIPRQIASEVTLSRAELANALKLAGSFSGSGNGATLSVGENGKHVELHSSDSAVGENRYRIPAKLKGEPFKAVFNWKYLLDGLKICAGEDVTIGVNGSDRPALMKNAAEAGAIYVVMPIKG